MFSLTESQIVSRNILRYLSNFSVNPNKWIVHVILIIGRQYLK